MRPGVYLLASFCIFAQVVETPHDILLKATRLGYNEKTSDQAIALLQQAVKGWQETDPRNVEYAETLTRLGMFEQARSNMDINLIRSNVEPLYKHALAIYQRSLTPPDDATIALTLELEAAALNAIGEVEEATPLSERAAVIRKQRVRALQEGARAIGAAYKAGNGITEPVLTSRTPPAYTDVARFLQIEGAVVLQAVVDDKGRPQDISLLTSLGYGLDESAADAVRSWRYRPGTSGGAAVPVIMKIEAKFRDTH